MSRLVVIPVEIVKGYGVELDTLGWYLFPAVPSVGDTIRLPTRPADLAATVMGLEWYRGMLPAIQTFAFDKGPSEWWIVRVWVDTSDPDVFG